MKRDGTLPNQTATGEGHPLEDYYQSLLWPSMSLGGQPPLCWSKPALWLGSVVLPLSGIMRLIIRDNRRCASRQSPKGKWQRSRFRAPAPRRLALHGIVDALHSSSSGIHADGQRLLLLEVCAAFKGCLRSFDRRVACCTASVASSLCASGLACYLRPHEL